MIGEDLDLKKHGSETKHRETIDRTPTINYTVNTSLVYYLAFENMVLQQSMQCTSILDIFTFSDCNLTDYSAYICATLVVPNKLRYFYQVMVRLDLLLSSLNN